MKKLLVIIVLCVIGNQAIAQVGSSYYTVRLSSFEASVNRKTVNLHWQTVCFLTFVNFQLQRSVNGSEYTTIRSFVADKLRCQQPFDFIDSTNLASGDVFYKINVGNVDGTFHNSLVRQLQIQDRGFGLLKVFPTVVASSLNFTLSNDQAEPFTATIINQSGVVVSQQKLATNRGISNYNLQTHRLQAGLYFLQVANTAGKHTTTKFIKQ